MTSMSLSAGWPCFSKALYRGTQWVVFERMMSPLGADPAEPRAFMHNLFGQGAFQGTAPRDAHSS